MHLALQLLCTDFPWCEGRLKCQLLEEIIITVLPASTSDFREEEQKLPVSTIGVCFFFSFFFSLLHFFPSPTPLKPLSVVSEWAFTLRIQHIAKGYCYSEHNPVSHIHSVISNEV